MRYLSIFFIAFVLIGSAACKSKNNNNNVTSKTDFWPTPDGKLDPVETDTAKLTSIEWTETEKKYNNITDGEKLAVTFTFKNTGAKPLVIYKVQPSCGCTAAEPPKDPILPGNTGQIEATFNSSGQAGMVRKDIIVYANTKGSQEHRLTFEVEVDKK